MLPVYAQRRITRNDELRASGLESVFASEDKDCMNAAVATPPYKPHTFLRAWRKSRKLTLEALAERMGAKVSTLSGWETGRRTLDLENLMALAAAYDVHPAALLFAPDDGTEKVRRMQAAASVAEQMPADAADDWIAMGRRLAPTKVEQ